MKIKKEVTICFRTSDELRSSLKKVAKKERRSLSSAIETILQDYLSEKKVLQVGKEKRRYNRKPVTLPAFVTEAEIEAKTLQPGIVLDVSLGGLRISIPKDTKIKLYEDEEKTTLEVVFTLPNEKLPVAVTCKPVRLDDTNGQMELGVAIVDADFGSYQKLQNYLM